MNKKKIYLGYCGVLGIMLVLQLLNLVETDWIFNGALVLLCLGQLCTTAIVPGSRANSGVITEWERQRNDGPKKPLLTWKLFFLLALPLIICTIMIAIL